MTELQKYQSQVEAISAALQSKLRLKPAPFPTLVARSRKGLPRHVWRNAQVLAEAQEAAAHPKLWRTLDFAGLSRSAELVQAHLRALDLADERRGKRLSLLGSLSFNLIVVVGLLIGVLVWRGFL